MHRSARSVQGRYPTPVFQCKGLTTHRGELWIKNDGLSHPQYGGNKVRKLERILERAEEAGATGLVTLGAAGSHHVLATTVFGKKRGLRVTAALWPQPRSPHAEETLRAALHCGLDFVTAPSPALALGRALQARRPGDYFIQIGGLGVSAVQAYSDAIGELKQQIDGGALPEPDVIVVPVGTGSTAAGLLAGCRLHGLRTRVVGVLAAPNPVARSWVLALALRLLAEAGRAEHPLVLRRQLEIDPRQLGAGYGFPCQDAEKAEKAARVAGLELDRTYTEKAFARALREIGYAGFSPDFQKVRLAKPRRALYWHTLSAAPLGPLLGDGEPLPEAARRLFL